MSVIWSGITEQGAIVPVQVDETGKVIARADVSGDYVKKTGDTMSGPLVLPGNPTQPLEAATKEYVDSIPAGTSSVFAAGSFEYDKGLLKSQNIASWRKRGVGDYEFYFQEIPQNTNYLVFCQSTLQSRTLVSSSTQNLAFSVNSYSTVSGEPTDTNGSFWVYLLLPVDFVAMSE